MKEITVVRHCNSTGDLLNHVVCETMQEIRMAVGEILDILEDGCAVDDECWECVIWENEKNLNEHTTIEFGSEVLARMFISNNAWTLQVL